MSILTWTLPPPRPRQRKTLLSTDPPIECPTCLTCPTSTSIRWRIGALPHVPALDYTFLTIFYTHFSLVLYTPSSMVGRVSKTGVYVATTCVDPTLKPVLGQVGRALR